MEKKPPKTHYLIAFRDPVDGKVVELRAHRVEDSSLGLSFVALSEFIFGRGIDHDGR